jgi:flagellar protein FlgJ
MIGRLDPTPAVAGAPQPTREARLQQAASQLEGVFVQQLYKAMRESVPQGEGIVSGGTGEEMFTALMDQHLAADTPRHWERGLTAALYRQLSRHLASTPLPAEPVPTGSLPDSDRPTAL